MKLKLKLCLLCVIGMILAALSPFTAMAQSADIPSDDMAMFEQQGAIIMLVDPQTGGIKYANDAAASFFGYTNVQLESMDIEQIIALSSDGTGAKTEDLLKGSEVSLKFEHRLSNGDLRNAELFANPIVYRGGRMLLVIAHDITAMNQLAQRAASSESVIFIAGICIIGILSLLLIVIFMDRKNIRRSKDEMKNFNDLRQAFINADDSLIYLKDESLRYIFVNHAFEDFFKKKAEEIIGFDDFALKSDDFSRRRRETDLAVMEKGTLILDEEEWEGRVYKTTKFPVRMLNGTYGVGAYKRDITDDRNRVKMLQKVFYRQKILADVLSMSFKSAQEQLDYVLHQSLMITESQYGYIYLYDEESREFTLNSWTNGVMQDCAVLDKQTKYQLEKTGIWGEVVRQRKPMIVNHFEQTNPLKKGFPNGHVQLKRFMSIPVIVDDTIVAAVGLANNPNEYDDNDIYEMTMLMNGVWSALKRREAQVTLSFERNKYLQTLISIGDGVMVVDNKGHVEMLNTVAQKLTGWNMEDALGRHYSEVFALSCELEGAAIDNPIAVVLATDTTQELSNHAILTSKDGAAYSVEDTAAPIKDDTGATQGVVMVFRDVTDKREQMKEIEYMSFHDSLTGLYNRRFFEEEIRRLNTDRNIPISIIMSDVNNLKLTNDVFGHTFGDELLTKFAKALQKACRADDIIARWGGDEFVVLLPKTSIADAEKIAARIKREFIKEKIQAIQCSISTGCDAKLHSTDDIGQVLVRAEEKMYLQKTLERDEMHSKAIQDIITMLHEKSSREKDHSQSVSELCQGMGRVLGLDEFDLHKLKEAGYLHDIGKAILAPRLLNERNQLTGQEWDEMKMHTTIGHRILSAFDDTLDMAKPILAHHENWDGTGYPKGLKADEIPLFSRIIAVAESYDRMLNRAEGNRAPEKREVIEALKSKSGTKYDPTVISAFVQMMDKAE